MLRPSGRKSGEIRQISLETNVSRYAEGDCLIKFGNTHVLCTASIDEQVPRFLRNTGKGWVTAEYSMLPRSTHQRKQREGLNGKGLSGRTQEIQRLIGRSLRSVVDLHAMGERQIIIDCDVLQADGGTRTAAITGAYVALHRAFNSLKDRNVIPAIPLKGQVAALSCGVVEGKPVADLDYDEDQHADVDANFVLTDNGNIIEIQGTAEKEPFSTDMFQTLLTLAQQGSKQLFTLQQEVLAL